MLGNVGGHMGKKVYKRWDDAEERLLAENVRAWGAKGWDRVAQEMKTDRTPKQLQEHWQERQKECLALLQEMGPAPRPVPATTSENAKKWEGGGKRHGKNQAKPTRNLTDGLTRVASLKYRSHPYSRDDRIRQECEAADLRRVRQAATRYLTHIHWLESLLMPSGDRNGGDLGGGKSALGGLEVVKEANATMVVHASTIEAQQGLIRQSVALVKKAEEMGVWEPLKAPEGTQQFGETSAAAAAAAGSEADAQPVLLPHQVRVVTDSEVCAGVVVELREGLLEKVRWHDV